VDLFFPGDQLAILRTIGSMLAGYLAMSVVVGVITAVLVFRAPDWVMSAGHPNLPYMGVNLAYSFAAALLGGYVTAWIAGTRPLWHGVVLGCILLVLSAAAAAMEHEQQPLGYQVALMALTPLGIVAGSWLRASRRTA
jgi:hypothetical protein